jgi:hypothetical protein
MNKLLLIAGLGAAMFMSGLQAEYGGMGYGDQPMASDKEAAASQASVMISSPADGAVLTANQPVKVSYQANPGPKGDHVHLYVNGERTAVLRQLAGDYELGMLKPGKHKISVEIVTKDHQHIGVGKEISIEVH